MRVRCILDTLFFADGGRSAVGRLGIVYKTNNNACYGVSIARYFLVKSEKVWINNITISI